MSTDEHAPKHWKERKLIGWKAWYTNGSTFVSSEWKWEDIPQHHFMGVKRFYVNPSGEKHSEMFVGQDLFVVSDEIRDTIEKIPMDIKVGEWMSDELFHPLYDMAKDEKEIIQEMI